MKYPREKNFGPTKYPREKILDPRNTHEKKFWTHEIPMKAGWHGGTKLTRPMKFTTLIDQSIFYIFPAVFVFCKMNIFHLLK